MEEKSIDEAEMYASKESSPETNKTEKIEPEKKELCESDDDPLTQLVAEESLDEALQENLAKDQLDGVRRNSAEERNGVDVGDVKEGDGGKENVAIVSVDEAPIENREVGLTASMVEPSLSSNPPLASTGQGLSLVSIPAKQELKYDSQVVNNLSVSPVLRSPGRDGYNWRKYGQKQVKSPKGSRSYYRCTHSNCCAKKIECSNDSGNMIGIVNKGLHSHEPPRKNSFSPRTITNVSVAIPPASEGNTVVEKLPIVSNGPDLPASSKENICQTPKISERKRHFENDAMEEPEPKQRLKKDISQSSDSVSKQGKKHKFVVHAANDVGISGDGYRWRKYGQKMVKGNPNPRNYYRCTSAGCPVRKHIETSVENTTSVVITYKGVHNHDTPVPKKRHGPPSSMLVAAAAPTSMRRSSSMSDNQVNNVPSSSQQCSVRRESEKQSSEPLDVGGEKAIESARTLLSIGFEIKQC